MKIQSLSICVPPPDGVKRCINACRFCVSKMHKEEYPAPLDGTPYQKQLYDDAFRKRLEFARDNGCNTVMLTGQIEPQQNLAFISKFAEINAKLPSPFKWIEIQTSGTGLTEEKLMNLQDYGVTTVSLSLSCLNSDGNAILNCAPSSGQIVIGEFVESVRKLNMNLRFSLNMNHTIMREFDTDAEKMFQKIHSYGPDQVTFRKLYAVPGTRQADWVAENATSDKELKLLERHIRTKGRLLNILEFGQEQYSLDGISYVVDKDCMAKEQRAGVYKYLILRPNMKLYSQWDDKGSLMF